MLKKNQQKDLPTILFIGQFPPPVHGVSLMNSYILNSKLIRNDFSVEVINLKFGKTINELEKFSFKKILRAATYSFEILRMMMRQKWNIIYFTITPTGLGFYRDAFYLFLLKLFQPKIILHLHGKGIKKNLNNLIKKKIYHWVFKNTHVICLSKILVSDIKDVYKANPFIVPNGIAIHTRSNPLKEKRIVPCILFVSNFIQNKGVLILVDALVKLKKMSYDFTVRFVGSPSNITIGMLEDVLKENGMEKSATVLGPLYGDAKFQEFENADIFVFPTYNDAFGLVNLEAMQYSLPVVSTYEGSIPEIVINNETGFLVKQQDAVMLSEKISILLKDENMRIRMGNAGYKRFIANYTLQHFESNMLKTFQTVLSAN